MADELDAYRSRYLPLPVDAYDLGIDLVLPRDALRLYEHVRRFVQRKDFKKGKTTEKHVYADIKQSVLADRIGHHRQWVNHILGMLEELGWLKRGVIEANPYGQKRYLLGSRSEDHVETFWADKKMEEYRRHICKEKEVKFAEFGDIAWADRVCALKAHLETVLGVTLTRGVSAPADRGMSAPADRGCPPRKTGGVRPSGQGVSAPADILNKQHSNTQDSKRQFSNTRGRDDEAVASAPASASGSGDFEPPAEAPEQPAGDVAANNSGNSPDHDESSVRNQVPAEDQSSAEAKVEYRKWLNRDDDATDVVDEDGELIAPGNDQNDQSGETDVNATEKALKAMADAKNGALVKHKETVAANEAKRSKNSKHRQLQKNLSGPNLEKHIPKGSVKKMERVWLTAFDEHYPDFSPAKWWTQAGENDDGSPKLRPGKESGLISQLVQMYSVEEVEKYLKWAVANWGAVQARFKSVPAVPAIGFLYGFRETLLPEAVLGNASERVEEELRVWYAEHPNEDVPADLAARIKALKGKGG